MVTGLDYMGGSSTPSIAWSAVCQGSVGHIGRDTVMQHNDTPSERARILSVDGLTCSHDVTSRPAPSFSIN